MEFLAAPLLWGLTAAGVPLAIHLIGRAKPIPHVFPAMRFILRSQRSSSRALKLKHVLVLLLRIAALFLIAMALARPFWNAAATPVAWSLCGAVLAALAGLAFYHREIATGICGLVVLLGLFMAYPSESSIVPASLRGDFVLILDQSASMGYIEASGTRLDLARKQALQFLERLAPESRVALIVATETADRVQGRLSFRHSLVREKLQNAVPTGRGFDMGKALEAAQEILIRDRPAEASGTVAVILFTDLQANAFNAFPASLPLTHRVAAKVVKPPLIVVDVGTGSARNGAAISAKLPGSILPADSKSELLGVVRPVDSSRPCLVELYIDERRVAQQAVDPKGEEVINVTLDFLTGSAGAHTGRLHLPDSDRLVVDQDFRFVYTAGRPASALIIEHPGEDERKGSGFFLKAALQYGSDDSTSMSGLTCVVQPPQELSLPLLSKYRVVMLADCGPLSASSWAALEQWTSEGGGLFVWLGPNTDPSIAKYGYQQGASYDGLLPGVISGMAAFPQPQSIAVSQPDHPVLGHFTSGALTVLSETRVARAIRIAPEPRDQNASVILSLSDGTPLLLEKIYGRGRVLCSAIDSGLECSDLPKRGEAFVTLMLDAARLLSGEDKQVKARLGMPMLLALPAMPADGQVLWKKPGAPAPIVLRVDSAGKTEVKGAPPSNFAAPVSAIVPMLDVTGIHQFLWYPAGAVAPMSQFVAVNSDPAESNLAKASNETVTKALAAHTPLIVGNLIDAPLLQNAADVRNGANRELTTALLLMLLGIMLAESFLSNRLYRGEAEEEPLAASMEKSNSAAPEPVLSEARSTDGTG